MRKYADPSTSPLASGPRTAGRRASPRPSTGPRRPHGSPHSARRPDGLCARTHWGIEQLLLSWTENDTFVPAARSLAGAPSGNNAELVQTLGPISTTSRASAPPQPRWASTETRWPPAFPGSRGAGAGPLGCGNTFGPAPCLPRGGRTENPGRPVRYLTTPETGSRPGTKSRAPQPPAGCGAPWRRAGSLANRPASGNCFMGNVFRGSQRAG